MSTQLIPVAETRRERVHRHLRDYPGQTAYEVARALRLPSAGAVKILLRAMLADGESAFTEGPRSESDQRPAIRWRAT